MATTLRDPRERWQGAGAGEHYTRQRWSDRSRAERDPRLVKALLAERLPFSQGTRILDAPCGTGRLWPALAERASYVGLDVSEAMLRAAGSPAARQLARGDLERLPFADRSFDAVVCCRLLHHLQDAERLERTVAELVRVSRRYVLASFWDTASVGAWRRRLLKRRPSGRRAHSKAQICSAIEAAGARVVEWRHSLRFLSPQTFVLAER